MNEPDIDAADIVERLVGITPTYLQNFLQRGSHGLRSSVKSGKVRSERRLFSVEDVYGFALVWLLVESGLRNDVIDRVLREVGGTRKPDANKAAEVLMENRSDYLVVFRVPRRPSKYIPTEPIQRVGMITKNKLPVYLRDFIEDGQTMLIVPVGDKFADVSQRMGMLFEAGR